ncbi:MAG: tetratricopeptide repeat protein [Chloroflexi bacterium]|nr:tetratricopeptide repeat protein [Chloroflexota bacterium]
MDEKLHDIDRAFEADDLRKAESLIGRLLKTGISDDERAQVLLRRARTRFLRQHSEDALADIELAREYFPPIRELAYTKALLGDIYFAKFMLAEVGFADRADTDRAYEYYNQVLQNYPHYRQRGWVHYQRGCLHLTENNFEKAVQDFHAGLEYDNIPDFLHTFCYERLGFVYLDHRDPEQAMHYLDKALATYPPGKNAAHLVMIHMLRSRALRMIENYEEALQAASEALKSLDTAAPNYKEAFLEAHLAMGEILANMPDREAEAIEHLIQFLQNSKRPLGVDVTWSRVYETLGDLSLRLSRHEQAIEAFNAALSFNPYHPMELNVRYNIARSYYRMKAYEKAIGVIKQMHDIADEKITDYRVYYVLGNSYFALERYDEAVSAYREAATYVPPNSKVVDKIQAYLRFSEQHAF